MKNIKDFVVKLLTIGLIIVLAAFYMTACGKTTKAEPKATTEQAAEKAAEDAAAAEQQSEQAQQPEQVQQTEQAQQPAEQAAEQEQKPDAEQKPDEEQAAEQEQKPDAEQKPDEEQPEEQTAEQEQAEEQQPEQEISEEGRLAEFARTLEELDPGEDRQELYSELVRVQNEEGDPAYQYAVIQRLLKAETQQLSPCTEGRYPIVRIFKGFSLVNQEGKVLAYQDTRHLHLKGKGVWKILNGQGIEAFEESTIIWKESGTPFWVLAQYENAEDTEVYLFYRLVKADVEEGDPVWDSYNKDLRQRVKEVVSEVKKEGEVNERNFNLLESIAFQMTMKPVKSEEYCVVQYVPMDVCRGQNLSERTLINLKVDKDGVLQKVDPEKTSLIIFEDGDLSIKVTIVTTDEVVPEEDQEAL